MKSFSIGTVRQWHWISGAVCLVGMCLFALTGITLNHAADIPANRVVNAVEAEASQEVVDAFRALAPDEITIPQQLVAHMASMHDVAIPRSLQGEWDGIEFYAAWPGPGADSWVALDVELGIITYENVDRGWIAYFNDLHKGRNTATAWRWFIDAFALACVVFSVTGLLLLMRHSAHRASTWPITALGVLIPFVILLLFVH
ncbi:MAG: PepSY-associated TM helix domain-containing protein [Pseudomonadota bacterium]|uniref:PepSY-associated TM helix domain-containing protein n=1 Tax=Alteromonas sp. 009811495 TaxID=3002962 RepID=UPI00237D9D45|nr:PepSY-associated TM helix domain-containing protein [Alteromonas sp. 009811495]WDT85742.1 PepSY-associated TM helix domain-containing protein [Alteromonas sp. 009811495]